MRFYPGVFASGQLSAAPSGYSPPGVAFANGNYLKCNALSCVDSPYFSMFFWFQSFVGVAPFFYCVPFVSNPMIGYYNWFALDAGSGVWDSNIASADQFERYRFDTDTGVVYGNTWHSVLLSVDTTLDDPNKLVKVYIDDIDRTDSITDGNAGFTIGLNGLDIWVGDDSFSDPIVGNLSDYWVSVGTSLFTGSDIAPATRRIFTTGANKPMDPSGFPGTPTILFSGDASTYASNLGSGGPFATFGPALITVPGPS